MLPHSKHDFQEYLTDPSPCCSFLFDPVTSTKVESEIDLLPTNKAHGLYSFPMRILECQAYYIQITDHDDEHIHKDRCLSIEAETHGNYTRFQEW